MLNITFIGNYLHIKRINYILNRIILTHSCVSQWVHSLIKAGEISSSLSLLNHVIFEHYIRLYTTTTSLASVVKRGPVLVKESITNNEHIYLPPYCYQHAKGGVEKWKALPFKYFLKETCLERSTGNASKKNKFNTIIPFLSTAKQTSSVFKPVCRR